LTRSGEFNASFPPFAPVSGNRVIRAMRSLFDSQNDLDELGICALKINPDRC